MLLIYRMLVEKRMREGGKKTCNVSFINHTAISACATLSSSSFRRKMPSLILGQTEFSAVMWEQRGGNKSVWREPKSPLCTRKTPRNYTGLTHMLSTCLAIIPTQIWHLAAPPTCVGMIHWSQVNVLWYNHSTPGQTEAHAVLYSSQERVHFTCQDSFFL